VAAASKALGIPINRSKSVVHADINKRPGIAALYHPV